MSVSMLLNPIATAPPFPRNETLEIPVPKLLMNLELVIDVSGTLNISKTASEKYL